MSVERLGGGSSPRLLSAAVWTLVAVAAVVAVRGGADARRPEIVRELRPAPQVTVVQRAPSTLDEVRAGLGRQWGGTFDALARRLPARVAPRMHDRPAQGVRDSAGRVVGFVWDDAALVEGATGSEPWQLSVEVMRREPWQHVYPCAPERWGMPGAVVLTCEVRSGQGWQRIVATSVPAGAGEGPDAAGWSQAVDVRDGTLHVQLLLTRPTTGTDPAPLSLQDLERLALDPAWRED